MALRLCTKHIALGVYGKVMRLNISRMSFYSKDGLPKLTTSNILTVLSLLALANIVPSALTVTAETGPRCPRYCFTNSIPTACFFQNLTTPSTEVVMMKSVEGVTVTYANVSRCMNDLVYRALEGRRSKYAFS
jgi:hypothetical protein